MVQPVLPVLGTDGKILQHHLPAHLDPATMSATSVADRARGNHTGTQIASTISDLAEAVHDAVAGLLVAGTGIQLAYNDTANTLTVTATGGGTTGVTDPEVVRDTIAAALRGAGAASISANDTGDTITVTVDLTNYYTRTQADAAVATALNGYYTQAEVDAAISAAIAANTGGGGGTVTPTAPYTPANVLNDGSSSGQNHFSVQVAPTGGSTYVSHTLNEIEDGYAENPYFYVTPDNWVHFQARVDAPTTSGSSFARCELRELMPDRSNAAINIRTGTHRMSGRSRIMHQATGEPEAVVAQLHDGNHDRIAIRTQAISSSSPNVVALSVRVNGKIGSYTSGSVPTTGYQESTAYVIGREFDWKIEGINDVWKVSINGTVVVTVPVGGLDSTSTAWYFKAGCYNQAAPGDAGVSSSDYFAVELKNLLHWHTGWATNLPLPVLT